jgi:hypothetical protein
MDKKIYAEFHYCEPPGTDEFQIELYPINHIDYDVDVVFMKGYGLAGVILTHNVSDPSAYETALAELTGRYGDAKPALKDDHLEWMWVKPHGNLTLSVYENGVFDIFYSRRRDKNTL